MTTTTVIVTATNSRWTLSLLGTVTIFLVATTGGGGFFCDGFQQAATLSSTKNNILLNGRSSSRRIYDAKSQLNVHHELITGGGGSILPDPQELSTHVHALHGYLQQNLPAHHLLSDSSSSSLLVSDAATIDAGTNGAINVIQNAENAIQNAEKALETFEQSEAALAQDKGWWQAYLNVFKTILESVHGTIDGPIHQYTSWEGGTWGFSIAIFTAGIRSLLIPLSIQQTKATEYNKALQPYVKTINEKFKSDENRKNQAIGKLYEDSQQNPLSGCLLSLVQLPIILGLYRGVRLLALDGKLDEKFLFIPSLEGPVTAATDYRGLDWLTQGWTQIDGTWTPSLGWETTLAFCIMPVVLVLGQKLTMDVLTPPDAMGAEEDEKDESEMTQEELAAKGTADRTKLILKFLPLLIGFFSLQVPAGLTIYWFTSNVFTLSQAVLVRKYYEQNPPNIELPDYWDALDDMDEGKTPEERRAAAKAGLAKGPSMEDWIDNAKFHTLVERPPIRENSSSWKRVLDSSDSSVVPTEFQSWVSQDVQEVNGSSSNIKNETLTAEPVPQA